MLLKKSGDKIIFIIVVCILLALFGATIFLKATTDMPQSAEIIVDGRLVQTISLAEEREYKITCGSGFNIVRTGAGSACVISSDCSDKTCIKMGHISQINSAVCLPHKFILRICSEKRKSDIDALSQ